MRLKVVAGIGAVLAFAGVASGLPHVPGWPLLGGAGGTMGDLVHNLASSGMGRFGFGRDSIAPLLILAFCGSWLMATALGLSIVSAARSRFGRNVGPARPEQSVEGTQAAPFVDTLSTFAPGAPAATEPSAGPAPGPAPARAAPRPTAAAPMTVEPDLAADDPDASARSFAERFAPAPKATRSSAGSRPIPLMTSTITKVCDRAAAYRKPSLNLLRRGSTDKRRSTQDIETGAATLLEVMAAFGVKGEIREARPGPVVTRYEFEPVRGTKIARIIALADDFARELGATAVRVSTTPGRTTIGIEVPNEVRETVVLRDVLESDTFNSQPMQLPLALGKGIAGEPIAFDLARMPHLLVAGTTGSGKSVGLNAMILSLLYRLEPTELRLLLIDPKMLELAQYDRIPHLLTPVITDPTEATQALEWAVSEMEERYRRMAQQGTRNIESFNAKVRTAKATGLGLTRTVQTGFDPATGRAIYERQQLDDEPMPYIVVVIDELADLMVTAGKRVEGSIQRLAQKARASGIHLVMATQRPSVDVVTGTIKANFPVRISFRVASRIDSRTIINEPGAEQLLGHGDMLMTSGSGHHLRVHGAFVSDEEIERVAEALRAEGEPAYVELLARPETAPQRSRTKVTTVADARAAAEAEAREHLYAAAVALVAGDRKVSPGHLHRRLSIPEDLAAALIERMEHEGLVGPINMFGRRAIHMKVPPPAGRTRSVA
jgi:S-DNA-T family DNA segregation ATPase FtsK/SpoIIIE